MKKNLLLSGILLLTVFNMRAQIVISGFLANPPSTDSVFEYVQLKATQNIDFSINNYSVVFTNNGSATANGWVEGGSLTFGFSLNSGSVSQGDVFYVGGNGKLICGNGSTDISSENWIRSINNISSSGDSFGDAGFNLGNGGSNADGIAVFSGDASSLTDMSVPIDAVFFGNGIGSAMPSSGGYVMPSNDHYISAQGTFGNGTNTFLFSDPSSGQYIALVGTYDVSSQAWSVARTESLVDLTTTSLVSEIVSQISLTNLSSISTNFADRTSVSAFDHQIRIVNNSGNPALLKVYNIVGDLVLEKEVNDDVTLINTVLTKGIYIVKLSSKNNVITQKIFIE